MSRFPHNGLSIVHVEPAEAGDMASGVARSVAAGATAQDVNVHPFAGGGIGGLHWPYANGWHDPAGRIDVTTKPISRLTLAQAATLRNRRVPSARIQSVQEIAAKAPADFTLCLEAKPHPWFETPAIWEQVLDLSCQVVMMTIQAYGDMAKWEAGALRRLKAAHTAGVPTMLLYRRPIPAAFWPYVDAVKGPSSAKLKAGVPRLGLGGKDVTAWGAGCDLASARRTTDAIRRLQGKPAPQPPTAGDGDLAPADRAKLAATAAAFARIAKALPMIERNL